MNRFNVTSPLWVSSCIVAGGAGPDAARTVPGRRRAGDRQVNLPVGLLIWVMIIPMLLKVDFGALRRSAALARHRRHAVRELGGQAVLDGAAGWAVHPPAVRPWLPAGRSTATSPA